MQNLVEEYQNTLTMLQKRQQELEQQLPNLHGEMFFSARRRLEMLIQEQMDVSYALDLMVGNRMWGSRGL